MYEIFLGETNIYSSQIGHCRPDRALWTDQNNRLHLSLAWGNSKFK